MGDGSFRKKGKLSKQKERVMSVLSIKGLSKSYGDKKILNNINLELTKSEILVILGHSGASKSTLLGCACFLERMDRGSLSYGDEIIIKDSPSGSIYPSSRALQKSSAHFGLVFQHFNLFAHFNVLKNITDAPIITQKRPKNEVKKQALALLEKLQISELANAYAHELSGGQAQRVAIARALAMCPQILFLDEPTSALDPQMSIKLAKTLRELANDGMSVCIVTHDKEFAKSVADKIAFLHGGEIIAQGSVEQILSSDNEIIKTFFASQNASLTA